MAIQLNDNIKVNAGKPVDSKYLNPSNVPYVSVAEALVTIPISERHTGLTVNVAGVEYFWKNGVNDSDLVIKETQISLNISGSAVTATARLLCTVEYGVVPTGLVVIDGVTTVAGNIVLLSQCFNPNDNGLYVVNVGIWTRSTAMDTVSDVFTGYTVKITEGTVYANSILTLRNANFSGGPALGSTPLDFVDYREITKTNNNVSLIPNSAFAVTTSNYFLTTTPFNSLTSGSYNISLGEFNMTSLTNGTFNIGIGNSCLSSLNTGQRNIGIGQNAGAAVTTGSFNIHIGDSSNITSTGSDNIVIGRTNNSLTGSGNIFVGFQANGVGGVSGASSNNTFIGQNANGTFTGGVGGKLGIAAGGAQLIGGDSTLLSMKTSTEIINPNAGSLAFKVSSVTTNDDPQFSIYQQMIQTTDGSLSTLYTIAIPASTTVNLTATVVARRTGGSAGTAEDGAAYKISATFKNVAGTATQIGTTTVLMSHESQAGWDCSFQTIVGNVRVNVTGALNNNITWHLSKLEYIPVGS